MRFCRPSMRSARRGGASGAVGTRRQRRAARRHVAPRGGTWRSRARTCVVGAAHAGAVAAASHASVCVASAHRVLAGGQRRGVRPRLPQAQRPTRLCHRRHALRRDTLRRPRVRQRRRLRPPQQAAAAASINPTPAGVPAVHARSLVVSSASVMTLLTAARRPVAQCADELELMPLATASDEPLGGAVCEAVEGGRRAQRPDASRVRQKRPSPRWFAILDLLSLLCLTCVAWWTIKGVLEIECLLEVSMMGETSSSDDTDDDGGVIDQGDGGRARLVECSSPLRTELDSHPGRIVAIGALTLTLLGLAFVSLLNAGNAIRRTGRRAEALRTHCCKAARRIHAHLHRRAPEISPLVANDAVVV